MEIQIKQGSITVEEVDAIVNPANSYGYMGGGVAKAIKEVGGQEIEQEAIHKSPTPVGEACITKAGSLPANYIIHAPTMHEPAEKTDTTKVQHSVQAALAMAENHNFKKLAMPGMGTGVGGLGYEEAAEVMIKTLKAHNGISLQKVILKDIDSKMCEAWKKYL